MANYERTIKSTIWNESWFESLNAQEKLFYYLIHTGDETSDTSIFPLSVKRIGYLLDMTQDEVVTMIDGFTLQGLVDYDYQTSEILVIDYFRHNPPRGGIMYEGYRKDFDKILSQRLLDRLAEVAKCVPITIGFFAALHERVPHMRQPEYIIKPSKETEESVKEVQKRGRTRIADMRGAKTATTKAVTVDMSDEEFAALHDDDGDLPF